MRIGIGCQLLSYPRARDGGLGAYMAALLPALDRLATDGGHELHLFWGADAADRVRKLGLDTARHHFSKVGLRHRALRLPWEQLVLPTAARAVRVDVFHFVDHVMSILPAAPSTVATIHDLIPVRMPQTFGRFRGIYKSLMARYAASRATRLIVPSASTKTDLTELLGVPAERVHVVHNAVDSRFRPVTDESRLADVRRRYHIPETFLLYVGRIEPRKNIDRALRAYARAREEGGVQVPFVLLAKAGWMCEDTMRLPEELRISDHVQIVSDYITIEDLAAVYSQAGAFIYPSLYEGFGLPVIEAMACGTPVITSSTSSMPEIAGDAALLVDPTSMSGIAQAISAVLSSPSLRAQLREAGLRRAQAFSSERTAFETLQVYRQAISC